jgi:ATP-dependent helicase/nuclease subunit B
MASRGDHTVRGVFTIPAGWPFVDSLAAGILAEAGDDPAALAEFTLLLPTRRAVRSLREAFLRRAEDRPLLLPRMMPLGDLDEDELAIAAGEEMLDAGADVPPAISGIRRQFLLTRLVQKSQAIPVEQAAMLALELARLIDRVRTERLSFDGLKDIVKGELARHWQLTLDFLEIVTKHWPRLLEEEGAIDAADRRNRLLEAQRRRWLAEPPAGPIIAAGSTGSIPATADLLAVIATLPKGAVVLPGFDPEMESEVAEAALADPQHPQHGMLRLLRHLDVAPLSVKPWPTPAPRATARDRIELLAQAMRPATMTTSWRDLTAPPDSAIMDFTRIDCPGADEESRVIALLLREALEAPGRTAALVTPDRRLARRVAAELRRWEIEIDDSAGTPLATTPPGTFLRLVAEAVAQAFAPIPLLALLKHPLAALGAAPATLRRQARTFEMDVLRGPRPAPGLESLRVPAHRRLIDALDAATAPLAACHARSLVPFPELLAAHVQAAEALAASDEDRGDRLLWAGEAGEAAAAFVAEAMEAGAALGEVAPDSYAALFDALIGTRVVRPRYGTHPRLSIWGLLEARLQQADLMILSGLNEGTWPPDGEADPWMSRPMRRDFGLPAPERRIGQTAHDFAQACAAPEVVLTRAERVDGTPTVPARWLVKLEKILAKFEIILSIDEAAQYLRWQEDLDRAPLVARVDSRPAPCPPLLARPRRLSVTQVETWMRDPYSIYARHVLGLRELDPVDAAPDRADYGTIIHRTLDDFVRRFPDVLPLDAYEQLCALGRARFDEEGVKPGVRAFWWPRFERIARWFVASEIGRRIGIESITSEITGKLTLNGPAGAFLLTGTADRIDRFVDGRLRIFDYKTGAVPTAKEVAAGFAPQLPLEAAIAEAGGFDGIPGAPVAELAFLRLTGSEPAGEIKPASKDTDPSTLAAEARAGLQGLVDHFDRADTPYEARPAPAFAPRYSPYEHLARVKEWASADGEGGE